MKCFKCATKHYTKQNKKVGAACGNVSIFFLLVLFYIGLKKVKQILKSMCPIFPLPTSFLEENTTVNSAFIFLYINILEARPKPSLLP